MQVQQLAVRVRSLGPLGEAVIVAGEADLHAAGEIRDALDAARSSRPSALVVDLSDAVIVDSSIVGLLLVTERALGLDGARLVVVCPQGPLRRAFSVSDPAASLQVVPTLTDAMRDLLSARDTPSAAPRSE